jgi:hypothetical protein
MIQLQERRKGWPPAWMIALAALGIFWFWYGLSSLANRPPDESPTWRQFVPFVLAGLSVVAGYGLVRGGVIGRAVAALVALAGAAPVVALTLVLAIWTATDPHGTTFSLTGETYGLPTWVFIAFVVAIVAGYGLVLVRAIRGH